MSFVSRKRHGFKVSPIHKRKEAHPLQYISERATFWIAVISILSFVTGNMMAKSGLYAFWHAVWGGYDLRLIEYTGTASPVASVPDYACWARYGGNAVEHTYNELPENCRRPLPGYDIDRQRAGALNDVYSVGFKGDYVKGADGAGSHPGVDIRVPPGTPVLAIANAIVTQVRTDDSGFGKYIVLEVPGAPSPSDPTKTIALDVVYAHLSAQFVTEGDMVQKGKAIGLSGQTGAATGPHLHFQIGFHESPIWPFTGTELREAGLSETQAINRGFHQERVDQNFLSPMLYVQANYPPAPTIVRRGGGEIVAMGEPAETPRKRMTAAELRRARLALRSARRTASTSLAVVTPALSQNSALSAHEATTVQLDVPYSYRPREWQKIRVVAVDGHGDRVDAPQFTKDIVLTTAYGNAEFRPKAILSPLDFQQGVAELEMLGLGDRTVVLQAQPFDVLSTPIKAIREAASAN